MTAARGGGHLFVRDQPRIFPTPDGLDADAENLGDGVHRQTGRQHTHRRQFFLQIVTNRRARQKLTAAMRAFVTLFGARPAVFYDAFGRAFRTNGHFFSL